MLLTIASNHVIFLLNFPYRSLIQISKESSAGSRNIAFCPIQNFVIQKEGRGENKYCASDDRKNGINNPSIRRPDNFAIAIPSTRLWEKANRKSATATLARLVNKQVSKIIPSVQVVRENQSIRAMDAT